MTALRCRHKPVLWPCTRRFTAHHSQFRLVLVSLEDKYVVPSNLDYYILRCINCAFKMRNIFGYSLLFTLGLFSGIQPVTLAKPDCRSNKCSFAAQHVLRLRRGREGHEGLRLPVHPGRRQGHRRPSQLPAAVRQELGALHWQG